MAKLRLNDDGTVTIPLVVPLGAEAGVTEVTLPEPSLGQLANAMLRVTKADEELPTLEPLAEKATPEQINSAVAALRDRSKQMFSTDAPYAHAVIDIIKDLTGQDVTIEQLPGWAANPKVTRDMLGHWQSPLGGLDSPPTTET